MSTATFLDSPSDTPIAILSNAVASASSSPLPLNATLFLLGTVPIALNLSSVTVSSSSVDSSTGDLRSEAALINGSVCLWKGLDVTAVGVLASIVLSAVIGLALWLTFGYLRLKFPQIYSVREWFLVPGHRPKPLRKTFWAFLWPHVPLVPLVPNDITSYTYGSNPQTDAALFPTDDELAQRTLWHIFLVVLAWTFVGLGGALPLYLVDTPCLADTTAKSGGRYSTLQDLSLLRLLQRLDNFNFERSSGSVGTFSSGLPKHTTDVTGNTEIRLIALALLVVVVAAAPAVYKLLYEFTRLVNYRQLWIDVKCGGMEMGWLSKTDARGFEGWGEIELKEFLIKVGLSTGFINSGGQRVGFAGVGANGRSGGECLGKVQQGESGRPDVDLQSLFTVTDTTRLSVLVSQRDIILNNLEVAETQYINSFRLSTPLPSVVDFEFPEPPTQTGAATDNDIRRQISRPRALSGSSRSHAHHHRHRRVYDPSVTPTSYVAPSPYYKLRDVRRVGRLSSDSGESGLARRISQRVIGSRFQELHRDSFAFGRIPLGSHIQLHNRKGMLGLVSFSRDQLRHGPNNPSSGNVADSRLHMDHLDLDTSHPAPFLRELSGDEYSSEAGPSAPNEEEHWIPSSTSSDEFGIRPRPPKPLQHIMPTPDQRSTFAMRSRSIHVNEDDETVPPPHLRLQSQQPFVRPVSGMDHDDLGVVYGDIRLWRARLKAVNTEIAEAQAENYSYIAEGTNVKGWLLVGRGVRFLPYVQMIEGRSKEDVRYDELQVGGGMFSVVVFWTVVGMATVLFAASLVAVCGLVMGPAPNVAHYLTFLHPLSDKAGFGVALATTCAPAAVTLLFMSLALFAIKRASRFGGFVSESSAHMATFKAFFTLTIACSIWLIACGSIIFALDAFATGVERTRTVASGIVYVGAFLLVLVIIVAIISPALLMAQPMRLLQLVWFERDAVTPRQRFRALYPRGRDPSFSTACCFMAVSFAATFSLIFPPIGPPVCLLLFLTLIAYRYLFGYVYARTSFCHTGGLLQIWLLRRFADLVALQPLSLGLILLARRLWLLGAILVAAALTTVSIVEGYAWYKLRLRGFRSLNPFTQDALLRFRQAALLEQIQPPSEDQHQANPPHRSAPIPRSSMASVLEMMSLTLAVKPSSAKLRGPVPFRSEHLDDLTATEQAARTNPNAPPRLPPLPFTTHLEEMQSILYAPELIAPPPVIWLPNDHSGVAQSEAVDLCRYHDLKTTLDVCSDNDISPQSNIRR